jgi:hypothetical protein
MWFSIIMNVLLILNSPTLPIYISELTVVVKLFPIGIISQGEIPVGNLELQLLYLIYNYYLILLTFSYKHLYYFSINCPGSTFIVLSS